MLGALGGAIGLSRRLFDADGVQAADVGTTPIHGSLAPGGRVNVYTLDYPGDETVYTINLQVTPDDPRLLQQVGFKVYGPQSGKIYAIGGAQPGLRPNVSANLISGDPGRYFIQIYNFDRSVVIDYDLTVLALPPEGEALPSLPPTVAVRGRGPDAGAQVVHLTYYRYGEVLLLLTPNDPKITSAPPVAAGDLDAIESALTDVEIVRGDSGTPFWSNPFDGPVTPRLPLLMQRGGTRGTKVLVSVNLASWIRDPETLDTSTPDGLISARNAVKDVGVVVLALNEQLSKPATIRVGTDYTLAAASPNWIANPFDGG